MLLVLTEALCTGPKLLQLPTSLCTRSKAEIATGEQRVQAIIATIERNENPFQLVPDQVKLHNILTQEVMSDDIRSQLLLVMEIRTKAYETLRKERFVEKSVRLSSTIHRTNLKTFLSIHKPVT